MPARKKAKKATNDEIPFEEAIDQVEQLVEEMENDQLPLNALVEHYEKGSKLLAHCENLLENARKRIEMLTINPEDVKNALEESEEAGEDASHAAGDDDPNEIRLF